MVVDIFKSVFIFIIYYYIVEPITHELGHALVLRKYEGYAAIAFYIPFVKKFKISIDNIEIFNVRNKRYKDLTYSKSDFLKLEDCEIIEVASAGLRNTKFLAIVIIGIAIILKLQILILLMFAVIILLCRTKFFLKNFNDFDVAKRPKEFKESIMQYEPDNPKKYENLIKEYEK